MAETDGIDPTGINAARGTVRCRWLGVAGLELECEGYTLLVDPHFTRPSRRALLTAARVPPNDALAERHVPRADAVLVTHPHYDHIMDVPGIARRTRAPVYGSRNAAALLGLHGVHPPQAVTIRGGDRLALGPFAVEVLPARHAAVPFSRLFNGSLPRRMALPLRLSDYRMDEAFSFRVTARDCGGECAMLIGGWPETVTRPIPAGVLFLNPYLPLHLLEIALKTSTPRMVIFIHWDDFTRPLHMPLQPMLLTRAQGLPRGFPPLRRMPIERFAAAAKEILPGAQIVVPRLFEVMEIG